MTRQTLVNKVRAGALRGACAAACFLLLSSSAGWATNGMEMIGYGAESSALGGADMAVVNGVSAMNINPAAITTIPHQVREYNLSLLLPNLHHHDTLGNTVSGKHKLFPLPSGGYLRHVEGTPWFFGLGFFAQGGMGAEDDRLATAFGTVDQTYSNVRYLKVTPTFAYKLDEKSSLGLALNVGYSDAEFRLFPNTSFFSAGADGTPGTPDDAAFFGLNLTRASAFGYGCKLGYLRQVTDKLRVGVGWTSKSHLHYHGGDLYLNMTAMGLGVVRYQDEINGFTWPERWDLGLAYRASPEWLVSFDYARLFWAKALRTVTVTGTDPSVVGAPATATIPFPFDWHNQTVWALGLSHRLNERITLRMGYNYGKQPVPPANLSPLFPAITERHLAAGVTLHKGRHAVHLAWEHAFDHSVTYSNPNAPFGGGAVERHHQNTIHFTWSCEY